MTSNANTTSSTATPAPTLDAAFTGFLRSLVGRNVSPKTVTAYETDLRQFVTWLRDTDLSAGTVDRIRRGHIVEYLSHLADEGRSGVTRARKLAAIRECFRHLIAEEVVLSSPAGAIRIPKKEPRERVWLRPDEYTKMLSCAGANPRDFAIMTLFLQTGIRVSELVRLRLDHVDLIGKTITVQAGKGNKGRTIDLEKKATSALKSYLAHRPQSIDDHVFLNYEGVGISDRGVKKLTEKYRVSAGIQKKVSCHTFRHTFGSLKARQGVSTWQLKEWLGHSSIKSTESYVHGAARNSRKTMEATSL